MCRSGHPRAGRALPPGHQYCPWRPARTGCGSPRKDCRHPAPPGCGRAPWPAGSDPDGRRSLEIREAGLSSPVRARQDGRQIPPAAVGPSSPVKPHGRIRRPRLPATAGRWRGTGTCRPPGGPSAWRQWNSRPPNSGGRRTWGRSCRIGATAGASAQVRQKSDRRILKAGDPRATWGRWRVGPEPDGTPQSRFD